MRKLSGSRLLHCVLTELENEKCFFECCYLYLGFRNMAVKSAMSRPEIVVLMTADIVIKQIITCKKCNARKMQPFDLDEFNLLEQQGCQYQKTQGKTMQAQLLL